MFRPSKISLALAFGVLVLAMAAAPAALASSSKQISILQDDNLARANPSFALQQMRLLGVQVIKVTVHWTDIAPKPNAAKRPRGFHPASPASYPQKNWAPYDRIVKDAHADGIQVYFNLSGPAPRWAEGANQPGKKHPGGWQVSSSQFNSFVKAFGTRYSGRYRGLPRVSFWSVWNEPNFGYSLAPQGVPGKSAFQNSARLYRGLVGAAWGALHQTGHGNDTFLFGELGSTGSTSGSGWREFQSMAPLVFLRALYCVNGRYRQLRGSAAAGIGCPTTARASRSFRKRNPALFKATGLANHPWMRWYAPTRKWGSSQWTPFSNNGGLITALGRVLKAYGSRTRMPIYNTEYGYVQDPPNTSRLPGGARYPSPALAGAWLNQSEYLSWKNPRIASFDNYVLQDPPPYAKQYTSWSSGLLDYRTLAPKASYDAWRLPLYMPKTSGRKGQALEVWGCVRPATYALSDTHVAQSASIQFAPAGSSSFTTVRSVTVTSTRNCYFDAHVAFPSSGTVRLAYTYPANDPKLAPGTTAFSRSISLKLR